MSVGLLKDFHGIISNLFLWLISYEAKHIEINKEIEFSDIYTCVFDLIYTSIR